MKLRCDWRHRCDCGTSERAVMLNARLRDEVILPTTVRSTAAIPEKYEVEHYHKHESTANAQLIRIKNGITD